MHAACLPIIGEDCLYVVFCQSCRQALQRGKVQHFRHGMLIMQSLPAPPSCQKEDILANRLGILRLQVPSVVADQPRKGDARRLRATRSWPFLQGRHGQDRPRGLPCLCLGKAVVLSGSEAISPAGLVPCPFVLFANRTVSLGLCGHVRTGTFSSLNPMPM